MTAFAVFGGPSDDVAALEGAKSTALLSLHAYLVGFAVPRTPRLRTTTGIRGAQRPPFSTSTPLPAFKVGEHFLSLSRVSPRRPYFGFARGRPSSGPGPHPHPAPVSIFLLLCIPPTLFSTGVPLCPNLKFRRQVAAARGDVVVSVRLQSCAGQSEHNGCRHEDCIMRQVRMGQRRPTTGRMGVPVSIDAWLPRSASLRQPAYNQSSAIFAHGNFISLRGTGPAPNTSDIDVAAISMPCLIDGEDRDARVAGRVTRCGCCSPRMVVVQPDSDKLHGSTRQRGVKRDQDTACLHVYREVSVAPDDDTSFPVDAVRRGLDPDPAPATSFYL